MRNLTAQVSQTAATMELVSGVVADQFAFAILDSPLRIVVRFTVPENQSVTTEVWFFLFVSYYLLYYFLLCHKVLQIKIVSCAVAP